MRCWTKFVPPPRFSHQTAMPGAVAGRSGAEPRDHVQVAIAVEVGELEVIGPRIAVGAGEA